MIIWWAHWWAVDFISLIWTIHSSIAYSFMWNFLLISVLTLKETFLLISSIRTVFMSIADRYFGNNCSKVCKMFCTNMKKKEAKFACLHYLWMINPLKFRSIWLPVIGTMHWAQWVFIRAIAAIWKSITFHWFGSESEVQALIGLIVRVTLPTRMPWGWKITKMSINNKY